MTNKLDSSYSINHGKRARAKNFLPAAAWCGLLIFAITLLSSWQKERWESPETKTLLDIASPVKVIQSYNLTVGVRWMNLDGGRWRPVLVCNGQSPCPTLVAREGDEVHLRVVNDLGSQISIHWSGMNHRRFGFWNDGTGGLNQYPILPRGNWTSKFDTTGHWGLNWYADHTGAGVADGLYGTVYITPHPSRPRPYSMITKSKSELRLIEDAEHNIRHLVLWNSDFRTADWKFAKMKGEGAGLYCYKSVLVNGKGRVHCRDPHYGHLGGNPLDESGCVIQDGFDGHACKPSKADYEIVETRGQSYIMLNVINVGFEHALKFSIDGHRLWVIANDAGFMEPQQKDVLYITNGARYTVLITLDKEPQDYAIRLVSTSILQNLVGYALLRYPAKRYPMLGLPMELPANTNDAIPCINPDSSTPHHCEELDQSSVRQYPRSSPPKQANTTLLWQTGKRHSKYEKYVTEYFVNERPWQLFRAAMEPVLFTGDTQSPEKPIQSGIPMGTVVDLIVQNTLNETIPMYKHGDPTYLLGSAEHEVFKWKSVADALQHKGVVDVDNAPMAVVHDLPPLGWIALRWKIDIVGATMFHAVKLRYFALGMAAPLLEGMDNSIADGIPTYAKSQPHIDFRPVNEGVFG